jgi:hypothetical protein
MTVITKFSIYLIIEMQVAKHHEHINVIYFPIKRNIKTKKQHMNSDKILILNIMYAIWFLLRVRRQNLF